MFNTEPNFFFSSLILDVQDPCMGIYLSGKASDGWPSSLTLTLSLTLKYIVLFGN